MLKGDVSSTLNRKVGGYIKYLQKEEIAINNNNSIVNTEANSDDESKS